MIISVFARVRSVAETGVSPVRDRLTVTALPAGCRSHGGTSVRRPSSGPLSTLHGFVTLRAALGRYCMGNCRCAVRCGRAPDLIGIVIAVCPAFTAPRALWL
ncbi:hypothetical protein BFF78_11730 [Streptomyces fodineus]|uniref:Uncharacterized protein n=1 Tax=Streptomyces fodineus TaxID=1904616 RepID=A0A1D7Y7U3_9ACTN|nr:hypothetical protein BFF78_11730 [Streptomyces fodineus]